MESFGEQISSREKEGRASKIEREIRGYQYIHYNKMNEDALRKVVETKTVSAIGRIQAMAMEMDPKKAASAMGEPVERALEKQVEELKERIKQGETENLSRAIETLGDMEKDLSTIKSVNRQMTGMAGQTSLAQSSTALPGGVSTLLKYSPTAREELTEKYREEAEKSQNSNQGETPEYKAAQGALEEFEAAKAALTVDTVPQI